MLPDWRFNYEFSLTWPPLAFDHSLLPGHFLRFVFRALPSSHSPSLLMLIHSLIVGPSSSFYPLGWLAPGFYFFIGETSHWFTYLYFSLRWLIDSQGFTYQVYTKDSQESSSFNCRLKYPTATWYVSLDFPRDNLKLTYFKMNFLYFVFPPSLPSDIGWAGQGVWCRHW